MEGICDFAIWRPGPKWKVGYTVFGRTSDKHGVVDHSSEGPLEATLGVLDSWRTVSWQFTVSAIELLSENNLLTRVYQHYPITDVCWHAGFAANKQYVGIEHCGRKDEPLTEPQYQTTLRLHRWLRQQGVLTVCERRVDLWEHNELMATDCPSGRIPWDRLIRDLKEEPMLTEEQAKKLIAEALEARDKADELEQAARGAVAAQAFDAVLSVLTGHWENLPNDLKSIKNEAEYWHRWEE